MRFGHVRGDVTLYRCSFSCEGTVAEDVIFHTSDCEKDATLRSF